MHSSKPSLKVICWMIFIVITNLDRYMVNRYGFCYYKLGQLLQIGSDLLQIEAAITN